MGICALLSVTPAEGVGQSEGTTEDKLTAIEVILDVSLVDNVLQGQGPAFLLALDRIESADIDFDSAGLRQIVADEFASERMRRDVVWALQTSAKTPMLEDIAVLMSEGSIGQLSEVLADYEPPESFDVYMRSLDASPAPRQRIELLAELADAQHAASLYLLLDESIREEAHRVAAFMTDGESPPYTELADSVTQRELNKGRQFAIAASLHRFRPVGDTLVAAAAADYRTEAGQEYVRTFSMALAESIQRATRRVIQRLRTAG